MSDRPDLHTDRHDAWDAGGFCNELVLDRDGSGTVCGYQKPSVSPNSHAYSLTELFGWFTPMPESKGRNWVAPLPCQICGCAVFNPDQHQLWHDKEARK